MIDENGFRLNVGVVVVNLRGKVLWAQRAGHISAWQFPQGGMHEGETEEQAMFRELYEELGLLPKDVEIINNTKDWLFYYLPGRFLRKDQQPFCIGQKQKWFLLRLLSPDRSIHLDASSSPEFDQWRWVDYWYPLEAVIDFKREVYRQVLEQFEPDVRALRG